MVKVCLCIVVVIVGLIFTGCSSPYEEEYRALETELLNERYNGR